MLSKTTTVASKLYSSFSQGSQSMKGFTSQARTGNSASTYNATQGIAEQGKNPNNVAGGFKATISNPNVSEGAKMKAEQNLSNMENSTNSRSTVDSFGNQKSGASLDGLNNSPIDQLTRQQAPNLNTINHPNDTINGHHLNHVVGGYKATINNPRVGEAAKARAQALLNDMEASAPGSTADSYVTQKLKGEYHPEEMAASERHIKYPDGHEEPMQVLLDERNPIGATASDKNLNNVVGGYKATISNPNTGEGAKMKADQVLTDMEASRPGSTADSRSTQQRKGSHQSDNTLTHANSTSANRSDSLNTNSSYNSTSENKHQNNVAGGYKATISNPRTSDAAKAKSEQILSNMENSRPGSTADSYTTQRLKGESQSEQATSSHARNSTENFVDTTGQRSANLNNVKGGYKATMHNPNVSDGAKANAANMLNDLGNASTDSTLNTSNIRGQYDATNLNSNASSVVGDTAGFQAVLNNPNASQASKAFAEAALRNGATGSVSGSYASDLNRNLGANSNKSSYRANAATTGTSQSNSSADNESNGQYEVKNMNPVTETSDKSSRLMDDQINSNANNSIRDNMKRASDNQNRINSNNGTAGNLRK